PVLPYLSVPFKVPVQALGRKGQRQDAIRNDEVVSVEWDGVARDCDRVRKGAMSSNCCGASPSGTPSGDSGKLRVRWWSKSRSRKPLLALNWLGLRPYDRQPSPIGLISLCSP